MKQHSDTYKETKIFEYPNATIRVHVPDLTDEERKQRTKALHKATAAMLQSYGRRAN